MKKFLKTINNATNTVRLSWMRLSAASTLADERINKQWKRRNRSTLKVLIRLVVCCMCTSVCRRAYVHFKTKIICLYNRTNVKIFCFCFFFCINSTHTRHIIIGIITRCKYAEWFMDSDKNKNAFFESETKSNFMLTRLKIMLLSRLRVFRLLRLSNQAFLLVLVFPLNRHS